MQPFRDQGTRPHSSWGLSPANHSRCGIGSQTSGLPAGFRYAGEVVVPRSVELKLRRAEEHIDVLDTEIQTFLAGEPYAAYRSLERGGLEHVIFWSRYKEPPPRLGLIAGDAIHNIRSSLDHMVVALAKFGASASGQTISEQDERRLQFPITMSPEEFEKQVRRQAIARVPPPAAAIIEQRQPYLAVSQWPKRFPLYEISQFDNADKHRTLTVALLSTSIVRVSWPPELSDTSMQTPGIRLEFEPDTEIARFVLPRAYSEEELPIDYRWGFTLAGAAPGILDIRSTLKSFVSVARFTVSQLSPFVTAE